MDVEELATRLEEKHAQAGRNEYGQQVGEPQPTPEEVPEGEVPPEEEQAPEETPQPEPRLYAGRYRSVEEMERAHASQQEIIDRQGNELGELRQRFDNYEQQTRSEISQLREDGFDPEDEDWTEWAEEAVQGGDMAALEAIEAAGREGGPAAARFVLNKWAAYDPAAAMAFQVEAFGMAEAAAAAAEEQRSAPPPEPPQRMGLPPEFVDIAYQQVHSRLPDLQDFRSEMGEVLLEMPVEERVRWEIRMSQDPSMGEELIETMYRRAQSLRARREQDQEGRTERADREALDTMVATGGSSHPSVPPPRKSPTGFDRAAFRREAGLAPLE